MEPPGLNAFVCPEIGGRVTNNLCNHLLVCKQQDFQAVEFRRALFMLPASQVEAKD
jgi:hypothetical protein